MHRSKSLYALGALLQSAVVVAAALVNDLRLHELEHKAMRKKRGKTKMEYRM